MPGQPRQPHPAGSPRDAGERISSSVYLKTHVQQVLELWQLREQARVQHAELHALSRLIEAAVQRQRRSRCGGYTNVCLERVQQFEQDQPSCGGDVHNHPQQQQQQQQRHRQHTTAQSHFVAEAQAPAAQTAAENSTDRPVPARSLNSDSSWITLGSRSEEALAQGLQRDPWVDVLHSQHNVTQALESEFRHELEHALAQVTSSETWGDLPYYRRRRRGRDAHRSFAEDEEHDEHDSMPEYEQPREREEWRAERGSGRSPASVLEQLTQEVQTLKSMIHASFDVQLDLQRAVRQEVAAAMSSSANDPASGSTSGGHLPSGRVRTAGTCVVCVEARIDSVFYACGHNATCTLCARTLLASGLPCPMCRAPIKDVIRVFGVDAS